MNSRIPFGPLKGFAPIKRPFVFNTTPFSSSLTLHHAAAGHVLCAHTELVVQVGDQVVELVLRDLRLQYNGLLRRLS